MKKAKKTTARPKARPAGGRKPAKKRSGRTPQGWRGGEPVAPETPTASRPAPRVTTHTSNGALPESHPVPVEPISVGEAMRRASEDLGEAKIDESLAVEQMRELGEAYEEVARRQAAFNARNEEAKTAKKSLEAAQELLLMKVKAFTHPTPLPLFDQQEAEGDRDAMLDAADGDDEDSASDAEDAFA